MLLNTVINCTDLLWSFSQSKLLMNRLYFSLLFPISVLLFWSITLFLSIGSISLTKTQLFSNFLGRWYKTKNFCATSVSPGLKALHGLCPGAVFTSWVLTAGIVDLKSVVLSLSSSAGCWVKYPETGFTGAGRSLLKTGGEQARRAVLTLVICSCDIN